MKHETPKIEDRNPGTPVDIEVIKTPSQVGSNCLKSDINKFDLCFLIACFKFFKVDIKQKSKKLESARN